MTHGYRVHLNRMSAITPSPVIEYLGSLRSWPHPELEVIASEGAQSGLPIVDSQTGSLLHALTRASGAGRALEIGTAIGFSGLWIATALSTGGRLITLERDAQRASIARQRAAQQHQCFFVIQVVGKIHRLVAKRGGCLLRVRCGRRCCQATYGDRAD